MEYLKTEATFVDKNVGPEFNKEHENSLLVRDLFNTIQGEMPYAGYPATFLRVGGCNRGTKTSMGCQLCDTDFLIEESQQRDVSELAEQLFNTYLPMGNHAQRLLVITGGEPMLQQRAIAALIEELREFYEHSNHLLPMIQFETNGDYAPTEDLLKTFERYTDVFDNTSDFDGIAITLVVSPKGRRPKANTWWNPEYEAEKKYTSNALRFLQTELMVYIRQVVSSDKESIYYNLMEDVKDFAEVYGVGRVYVSPATVYSKESIAEALKHEAPELKRPSEMVCHLNNNRAMELCEEHNVLMSFQSHVYAGIK